jgi:hypothetical protein
MVLTGNIAGTTAVIGIRLPAFGGHFLVRLIWN